MKKLLLTLCVTIALCGSLFAQQRVDGLDPSWVNPDWPVFNDHAHALNAGLTLYVQVNGEFVNPDNYENFVVAAFDMSGECRGMSQFFDETDLGDLYPTIQMQTYYDNPNEALRFEIYDHVNQVNYDVWNSYDLITGEPVTILSGEDHTEVWEIENGGVVLAFTGDEPATTIDLTLNGNNQWYLISSPAGTVDCEDVTNLMDGEFDFYYFNQAETKEWINIRPENYATVPEYAFSQMTAGVGYLYSHNDAGTRTLKFPGPAYGETEMTVTLAKANNAEFSGWNLVGNPFNAKALIGRPFYRMEEGALLPTAVEGEINEMEGVFVNATENGEEATFTLVSGSKSGNLALNVTKNSKVVDRAIVSFSDSQKLPKLQMFEKNAEISFPFEGNEYAVVTSDGMAEMPVNFKAAQNGTFTLNFTSQEVNFSYLHLIDNMTGNDVNLLTNPTYSFNALSNDYASRFRLVFATDSSINGDSFGFINGAGNFCIYGIDGTATVQVMDVTGRIMSSDTFSGSYEKQINAAAGVYMIRLINGNDVKVQKIVIK